MFISCCVTVTGEIMATKDLTYAVDGGYVLSVTASDGDATTVESLLVDLTSKNITQLLTENEDKQGRPQA